MHGFQTWMDVSNFPHLPPRLMSILQAHLGILAGYEHLPSALTSQGSRSRPEVSVQCNAAACTSVHTAAYMVVSVFNHPALGVIPLY